MCHFGHSISKVATVIERFYGTFFPDRPLEFSDIWSIASQISERSVWSQRKWFYGVRGWPAGRFLSPCLPPNPFPRLRTPTSLFVPPPTARPWRKTANSSRHTILYAVAHIQISLSRRGQSIDGFFFEKNWVTGCAGAVLCDNYYY